MGSLLSGFFYPSSICIAGASSKAKSIGYELLKSIISYGYTGKIYPVNPNADEILNQRCFKSISEINEEIDLAIVAVPKKFVEESIDDLLKKNVKSIILITAGFRETGKEGEEFENRILSKIKKAGARLVGPNCMGVINTLDKTKLNATFVAEKPEQGSIAFLSQSGSIGAAILNSLRNTEIKFAHFISVGNKADVCENDLLAFWEEDNNIKTICLYLESFSDGENLIKSFADGEIKKPVIILKAGNSSSGMKAASSHTGALGSDNKVVDSVLNQFGIIRTQTLDALFNTAKGFENFNLPRGNRIAVVTNGGGYGILTVDSLEKNNLKLAELNDSTKKRLKEIIHPEGSAENPVDLLPAATAEIFKSVNEILCDDENVDVVISVFVEPVMVGAFEVIEAVNSINVSKPIFQVVMPLPEFWEKYKSGSATNKLLFKSVEEAVSTVSNMFFYSNRKSKREYLQLKRQNNIQGSSRFLSIEEVNELAETYQLPVIESLLVDSRSLNKNDLKISYPLVLKGISRELVHKSDINGVCVNIKNREKLFEAEMKILCSFKEHNISLEKFLIQPYIKSKHELLIGGFRDSNFGPMIMFGTGGKYVETFDDTALKSAYISDEDMDEIITSTKIGKILGGVRGEKPVNLAPVKQLIKSCAQMMLDNPNISEFDFNPVIVTAGNSLSIVDTRIKLS